MMFPGEILINKHAQVFNITFTFQGRVRVGVMIKYFKVNFIFDLFCLGRKIT